MARTDFDKFVQRKKSEEQTSRTFDPEQRLDEWFRHLEDLYTTADKFLRSYIDDGIARIEYREIVLNEDFSGPYKARQMLIHIGSSTITLTPIGTMLIGAKGRVDVQGPRGTMRLVLVSKDATHAHQLIKIRISVPGAPPPPPETDPEQIELTWKIATPPPELKFTDLTEDNFFDMILNVADA